MFSFLAALLAMASPAGTSAPLPPFVVGYEPTTVDERGLWMDADNHERHLRDSKLTVREEALNRYITGVLCRTVGAERCRGVRVYVVEVPAFNATMAANGTMTVWTGLLLRVRNEAELAAILGHEFAHFELRHSLQGFKQRRQANDIGAWIAVMGGLANTNTGSLQTVVLGSSYRFNREQEQAADILGFKYLAAAGYPGAAASEVWHHIMAEQDASAVGLGQKPRQKYAAGFFDTHPAGLQRAEYLAAEARKMGDSRGDARAAQFRTAISPYLPAWLEAQVKMSDFGGTEYLLQQLAGASGWTGELLFARGELYRQRGKPRDLVTSVQFYRDALAAGYNRPQIHRNLGTSLLRTGQPTEAKAALSEYLRLLPEATDMKAVQALLLN